MDRRASLATVWILGVVLAISGLTACGGGEGQVEIVCTPPAVVSVDGSEIGTTPQTVTLSGGSHEFTFSRDGFATLEKTIDVEGGATSKLEETLEVAGGDGEDVLCELAEAIGIEREPADAEPVMMRGGPRAGIVLYWPQGQIRTTALRTYRVDVGVGYKGDGFIVFRVGKKVLHREPFQPRSSVVVESIPSAVLTNLKLKRTVTWGVEFEGRRRRAVTARFAAVKSASVDKRLAKLEGSKHFRRQHISTQEILKADVLRSKRHNSEALIRYIAIAQAWPDGQAAYRGIMASARGLNLEDTGLYSYAAVNTGGVKGKGMRAGPSAAALTTARKSPWATGRNSGARHVPDGPLAGPTLDTVNGEAPGDDVADGTVPGEAADGTVPGEVDDGTVDDGDGALPPATAAAVDQLNQTADRLDAEAQAQADEAKRLQRVTVRFEAAQRAADKAAQAQQEAQQEVQAAQQEVQDAQRAVDEAPGPAEKQAAEEALGLAQRAAAEADQKLAQAEEASDAAQRKQNEVYEEAGGDPHAQAQEATRRATEAAAAARRAREAAGAAVPDDGVVREPAAVGGQVADELHTAARALQDEAREHEREAARLDGAARRAGVILAQVHQASEALGNAQNAIQSAQDDVIRAQESVDQAGTPEARAEAERALAAAQEALESAQAELEKAQGDQEEADKAYAEHMAKSGVADPGEARAAADEARHRAAEAAEAAEKARLAAAGAQGAVPDGTAVPADPATRMAADLRKKALDLETQARQSEDSARNLEALARTIHDAERGLHEADEARVQAEEAQTAAQEAVAAAQQKIDAAANPTEKAAAEAELEMAQRAAQEADRGVDSSRERTLEAEEAHQAAVKRAGGRSPGDLYGQAAQKRRDAEKSLEAADQARQEADAASPEADDGAVPEADDGVVK